MFLLFSLSSSYQYVTKQEEKSFIEWMRYTGNCFVGSEYSLRLGIWLTNKRRIQEHNKNAEKEGFRLSINHLTHLTETEYKILLGSNTFDFPLFLSLTKANNDSDKKKKIPSTIDYRDEGVVNEIKDQGQCGSCWAFSITSASESNYALKFGQLYSYSEQNLVDCVTCSFGCSGGLPISSLMYIQKYQNGKFMSEQDYPYTGTNGACKFDSSRSIGSVSNIISTQQGSEQSLASGVAQYGVASAIIDASHFSFQSYSSGIYYEKCCSTKNLDHAVSVVGYGSNYWIIRNSFGKYWGENGYMRLARNRNNNCGIASMTCFPIP